MRKLIAAALIATLAGCVQGERIDPRRIQYVVEPGLPAGPPIQYRPTTTAFPFQLRRPVMFSTEELTVTGTIAIEQLEPGRLRVTHTAGSLASPNRFWDSQNPATFQTKLDDWVLRRFEIQASGRYLVIEPTVGAALFVNSKDWANLFEDYEMLPFYRADIAVGSPVMPTTPAELFDKRVGLLEAMVRGNTSGFWEDLPKGGTMTKVQRDILTANIRARAMPAVYEGDVRVRGKTTLNGRNLVVAGGTIKRSLPGGATSVITIEHLLDPASGLSVLTRVNTVIDPVGAPAR